MYKIAHCADVHIKNLKYHYEYRKVFEQMYETLRKEEVDFIISTCKKMKLRRKQDLAEPEIKFLKELYNLL